MFPFSLGWKKNFRCARRYRLRSSRMVLRTPYRVWLRASVWCDGLRCAELAYGAADCWVLSKHMVLRSSCMVLRAAGY